MSIRLSHSLYLVLPIAAAALFIRIGSAVAASPPGDIQEQMREVLSGSIVAHATQHSESASRDAVPSDPNAQEFARQLLLGWSVSHAGGAKRTKQRLQAEEVHSSQKPQADEDFQSTVRQSLLGESASVHGAL
jgi:hypothetical protein